MKMTSRDRPRTFRATICVDQNAPLPAAGCLWVRGEACASYYVLGSAATASIVSQQGKVEGPMWFCDPLEHTSRFELTPQNIPPPLLFHFQNTLHIVMYPHTEPLSSTNSKAERRRTAMHDSSTRYLANVPQTQPDKHQQHGGRARPSCGAKKIPGHD